MDRSLHNPVFGFSLSSFPILLAFVVMLMLFLIIRELIIFRSYNKQPVENIRATVSSKRLQVIHHLQHFETHFYYPSSTFYFVSFVNQYGEIMEFEVNGIEYGKISEGEYGELTFQGKDFLQFMIIENHELNTNVNSPKQAVFYSLIIKFV